MFWYTYFTFIPCKEKIFSAHVWKYLQVVHYTSNPPWRQNETFVIKVCQKDFCIHDAKKKLSLMAVLVLGWTQIFQILKNQTFLNKPKMKDQYLRKFGYRIISTTGMKVFELWKIKLRTFHPSLGLWSTVYEHQIYILQPDFFHRPKTHFVLYELSYRPLKSLHNIRAFTYPHTHSNLKVTFSMHMSITKRTFWKESLSRSSTSLMNSVLWRLLQNKLHFFKDFECCC